MHKNGQKKRIVISAVNLVNGGPLSILKDCSRFVNDNLQHEYEIFVLVHDKQLVAEFEHITPIAYPAVKPSWLKRMIFEFHTSYKLSKELKPYLWLALHDISPRVSASVRAVYCHNPSPFYKISWEEMRRDFKFLLFNKFYKYLYMINIRNNDHVIVQQEWLRNAFKKTYKPRSVIVSYPDIPDSNLNAINLPRENEEVMFFYPSFPRIFKNFEVLFKAAQILEKKQYRFKLEVTISGLENKYAQYLKQKYSSITSIKFLGLISREEVFKKYRDADCLLFPSKLETWGLPISEMKQFNKPVMVAKMGYAYETVGKYDKAKFFAPNDAAELAGYMEQLITGSLSFDKTTEFIPASPFTRNWRELFDLLLAKHDESI